MSEQENKKYKLVVTTGDNNYDRFSCKDCIFNQDNTTKCYAPKGVTCYEDIEPFVSNHFVWDIEE